MSLSSVSVITQRAATAGENERHVDATKIRTRNRWRRAAARRSGRPLLGAHCHAAELTGPDFDLTIDDTARELHRRRAPRRRGQRPGAGARCCACARATRSPSASPTSCASAPPFTGTDSSCPPTWTACRACRSTASRPAPRSPIASRSTSPAPTGTTRIRASRSRSGLYGPIVVERRGGERHARRPRARAAAVRLDGSRSRAHLRHAQAAERLLQLRQAHGRRTSSPTCANRAWRATRRRPAHVGRDAHESHRPRRRRRLRLHLSTERRHAGRATGPACSRPANACACASSTARR